MRSAELRCMLEMLPVPCRLVGSPSDYHPCPTLTMRNPDHDVRSISLRSELRHGLSGDFSGRCKLDKLKLGVEFKINHVRSRGAAFRCRAVGESTTMAPENLGKKICVLGIDGGGVRGIIPSTILEFLEEILGGPCADYFDVIAGTSTGGLLTAMLTAPERAGSRTPKFSAADVSQLYLTKASTIFPKGSELSSLLPFVYEIGHPKYDGKGLVKVADEVLSNDYYLSDTLTNVVIPAFDIATQEPVIFNNLDAQTIPASNPLMKQVCLGTSAAPTFLPAVTFTVPEKPIPKQPSRTYNLVDGGVVLNNPAHVAVVQAIKSLSNGTAYGERIDKWNGYQDILLLSLGTGNMPVSYEASQAAKWGLLGWVHDSQGNVPLVDVFSNGSSDLVDYNLAIVFDAYNVNKENYLRIQTDSLQKNNSAIDDGSPQNMQSLVKFAKDLLDQPATDRDPVTGKLVPEQDGLTNRKRLLKFAQQLKAERAARAASARPNP